MAEKCEICGKVLQSRKAYAGHMRLAHDKRVGFMAEFDAGMLELSGLKARVSQLEATVDFLNKIMMRLRRMVNTGYLFMSEEDALGVFSVPVKDTVKREEPKVSVGEHINGRGVKWHEVK